MEDRIKIFTDTLTEKFGMEFEYQKLKKYYRITHKIVSSVSAYAFVDMEGNIYMAASWKAPAKHIRGHIDEPFKNNCCGKYGIKSLK